jgi:hypothetical protein
VLNVFPPGNDIRPRDETECLGALHPDKGAEVRDI